MLKDQGKCDIFVHDPFNYIKLYIILLRYAGLEAVLHRPINA